MRLMFFSKCSKFNVESENTIKKLEQCLVFQRIGSELVVVNYPYYYENTIVVGSQRVNESGTGVNGYDKTAIASIFS